MNPNSTTAEAMRLDAGEAGLTLRIAPARGTDDMPHCVAVAHEYEYGQTDQQRHPDWRRISAATARRLAEVVRIVVASAERCVELGDLVPVEEEQVLAQKTIRIDCGRVRVAGCKLDESLVLCVAETNALVVHPLRLELPWASARVLADALDRAAGASV